MRVLSSGACVLLLTLSGCGTQRASLKPFLDARGKEVCFLNGEKVLKDTPAATFLQAMKAIDQDDYAAFADCFVPNVRVAILQTETKAAQWKALRQIQVTAHVDLQAEVTDKRRATLFLIRSFKKGTKHYHGPGTLTVTLLDGHWLLDGWEVEPAGPDEEAMEDERA